MMLRYKLVFCALLVAGASAAGLPRIEGPSQKSMQAAVDHINKGIKEVTDKFGNHLQALNNATAQYATGPERRHIYSTPQFATPAVTLPGIDSPAAPVLPTIPFPESHPGKGASGPQFSRGKGAPPTIVMPKTLVPEVPIPPQRFPTIHFGKAAYRPGNIILPKDWKPPSLGLSQVELPSLGTTTTRLPALVIPTHSVAIKPVAVQHLTLSSTTIPTPKLEHQTVQVPVPELGHVQPTITLPTAKLTTTSVEVPVIGTGKYKTPPAQIPVLVPKTATIYLPRLTTQKLDLVTPHAGPQPEVSGQAVEFAQKQVAQGLGKLNVNVTEHAKGKGSIPRHPGALLKNVTWPHWENRLVNISYFDNGVYKLPPQEVIVPTFGQEEVKIPIVALGKGKTVSGPKVPAITLGSHNVTLPSVGFKNTSIPWPGVKTANVTLPTLVRGQDVVIPGAKVPALTIVPRNVTVPVVRSSSGPITIVPPKLPWIETSILIPAPNPPAIRWRGFPDLRWKKLTPLGRPTVEADFPGAVITGGGKGRVTVNVPAGGGMTIAGKGAPLLNVTIPAYKYESRGAPQKGAMNFTMPELPHHHMIPDVTIPSMPEFPNVLPESVPTVPAPELPNMQPAAGKGARAAAGSA